jgi:hypothetical protein
MIKTQDRLSEIEVKSFVTSLAFVREFSIDIVMVAPGAVTIEMPFDECFPARPRCSLRRWSEPQEMLLPYRPVCRCCRKAGL